VEERKLGLLSVVVPLCNEEETVEELHRRVCATLESTPFELILVDDGSTDRTAELIDELAETDPRVRTLLLSRNFGHQAALTAGLDHARGDATVMLDADLQDPPELIPTMLDHWRRGSDVVYAVRERREGETWFKLRSASAFYRLFARLTRIELESSGDFRLLDRRALDALLSLRERSRFLRGMTVWVGYTQSAVPYRRDPRLAGETKYTLGKMVRFALDAISSFSHFPLQLATLMGFACSALAFLCLPIVIAARVANVYVPGVSSVLFAVLLLGGIQLITVGIIGEYVGRIYDEVKQRPLYLVRGSRNMGAVDELDRTQEERLIDVPVEHR
jgi:polyisoprenyl-phosphate glycosyltransferase